MNPKRRLTRLHETFSRTLRLSLSLTLTEVLSAVAKLISIQLKGNEQKELFRNEAMASGLITNPSILAIANDLVQYWRLKTIKRS